MFSFFLGADVSHKARYPPPPPYYRRRRFPVTVLYFQVCDFIQRRDGHRADPDNVFLTNGASEAVRLVLRTTIRGPSDGVMVPVPQVRAFQGKTLLSVELTVDVFATHSIWKRSAVQIGAHIVW